MEINMKKVNVRVKPKNVKSLLGRSYIVATVLGAALCAIILSFVLKPYTDEPSTEQIQVTEIEPIQIAEIEPVEVTPLPEVVPTEPPEILSVPQPEEAEAVGLFGNKDLTLKMPISGEVTQNYSNGKPVKNETTGVWQTHNGIDIKGTKGAAVLSPADGKITNASSNALYGNTVTIDHGDGYVSTIYNLDSLSVESGQNIKAGEQIGTVGSNAAAESDTEPHVHFELKENGKYVDPNKFIE